MLLCFIYRMASPHLLILHLPLCAVSMCRKIMVNACCPGWCQTDMSSWRGPKTAQEGADTPVMLALRSPQDFATGSLWGERQPLSW